MKACANYGVHCSDLHETGDSLYRTVSQSDEKCVTCGQTILYCNNQSTVAGVPICTTSQMADGIVWISTVPNFAQIRQGVWKVREELIDCIT